MPDTSPPPVVRVAHLTKRYGAHAVVDDLSFDVAAGETLVLLGPSGCGKTTLLKLLNRLIEPDGGTVEINGRDVRRQAPEALRRGIGYVIQQVGLLPHYTVAQNIAVVPGLLGRPAADTAARTAELLDRLHLPPARFAHMLPAQLSGGQQQRVGIARALAADPPIVLMDEPFGALDPITRAAVRRDFRALNGLGRKTVVLVTHDVQEAFELGDRVLLLNNGRIQQLGPPRELLLHPANAFVRSFFQAERLALQLRVLTLADLLPYLVFEEQTALAGTAALPLSTSVQEALALFSADPAGSFAENTDLKPIDTDDRAPKRAFDKVLHNADAPKSTFDKILHNADAPKSTSDRPLQDAGAPKSPFDTPLLSANAPKSTFDRPLLDASAPKSPSDRLLLDASVPKSPSDSFLLDYNGPKSSFGTPAASAEGADLSFDPLDGGARAKNEAQQSVAHDLVGGGIWLAVPEGPPRLVVLPQLLAAFGRALQ